MTFKDGYVVLRVNTVHDIEWHDKYGKMQSLLRIFCFTNLPYELQIS